MKIKNLTNWQPNYNFETGLIETIEWLKENLNLFKAEIYNV